MIVFWEWLGTVYKAFVGSPPFCTISILVDAIRVLTLYSSPPLCSSLRNTLFLLPNPSTTTLMYCSIDRRPSNSDTSLHPPPRLTTTCHQHHSIHIPTSRPVAIKQIDLEDSDDDISEIQLEISHLADCDSDYVTRYYGSFLKGWKLWIGLSFC